MTHGSLFSGIGGFDLAAQWVGWENIFHCEINPFGQKVLHYYWPKATQYNDIKQTDFTIHRGQLDILSGGFPCQPYSTAGKRLGKEDDRHLWPEMLRAIREIQPRWVVGENVRGLTNWNGGLVFDEVQADLENAGYEVLPFLLPACAVNAPHRRDRIWFVAFKNTNSNGRNGEQWKIKSNKREQWNTCTRDNERLRTDNGKIRFITYPDEFNGDISGLRAGEISQQQTSGVLIDNATYAEGITEREQADKIKSFTISRAPGFKLGSSSEQSIISPDSNGQRLRNESNRFGEPELVGEDSKGNNWDNFPTQSPVRSRNDGFSGELVGITVSKYKNESIKAYGNAIVPQVVFEIFKAIQQYEIDLLT